MVSIFVGGGVGDLLLGWSPDKIDDPRICCETGDVVGYLGGTDVGFEFGVLDGCLLKGMEMTTAQKQKRGSRKQGILANSLITSTKPLLAEVFAWKLELSWFAWVRDRRRFRSWTGGQRRRSKRKSAGRVFKRSNIFG